MKTVTMIDSYKERNGYLCRFFSVFLKKIHLKGNLAMTISSNRYLLIQLHFTLNIIVYYSLHSCCFLKQKLKDILSFKSQ